MPNLPISQLPVAGPLVGDEFGDNCDNEITSWKRRGGV